MKTTIKLTLAAAALAFIGTAAALADDPQLQNRLALQRNQIQSDREVTTVQRPQKEATVAFYGHNKSIGRTETTRRGKEGWREVSTPQGGKIDYVAPAD